MSPPPSLSATSYTPLHRPALLAPSEIPPAVPVRSPGKRGIKGSAPSSLPRPIRFRQAIAEPCQSPSEAWSSLGRRGQVLGDARSRSVSTALYPSAAPKRNPRYRAGEAWRTFGMSDASHAVIPREKRPALLHHASEMIRSRPSFSRDEHPKTPRPWQALHVELSRASPQNPARCKVSFSSEDGFLNFLAHAATCTNRRSGACLIPIACPLFCTVRLDSATSAEQPQLDATTPSQTGSDVTSAWPKRPRRIFVFASSSRRNHIFE